jgi:hypothetical protein
MIIFAVVSELVSWTHIISTDHRYIVLWSILDDLCSGVCVLWIASMMKSVKIYVFVLSLLCYLRSGKLYESSACNKIMLTLFAFWICLRKLNMHMWMSHYSISGDSYFVTLSDNGPVVLGANITFKAELFTSYGTPPSGTFRFSWKDDAIPRHVGEVSCYSLCYFNTLLRLSLSFLCVCVCVCVYIYIYMYVRTRITTDWKIYNCFCRNMPRTVYIKWSGYLYLA